MNVYDYSYREEIKSYFYKKCVKIVNGIYLPDNSYILVFASPISRFVEYEINKKITINLGIVETSLVDYFYSEINSVIDTNIDFFFLLNKNVWATNIRTIYNYFTYNTMMIKYKCIYRFLE